MCELTSEITGSEHAGNTCVILLKLLIVSVNICWNSVFVC